MSGSPTRGFLRAHLILRFDQGKWVAIDNGSVNGTFVNGYRRPVIDIHDGQSINIGNAGGPLTHVRDRRAPRERRATSGRRACAAPGSRRCPGRRRPVPHLTVPPPPPPVRPREPPRPRRRPRRTAAAGPTRAAALTLGISPPPSRRPPAYRAPAHQVTWSTRARRRHSTMCRPPKSPCSKPGRRRRREFRHPLRQTHRAERNAVVQAGRLGHDRPGVGQRHRGTRRLASRYHATLTLTPLGTEIRDTSVNGTFVNGTRVGSAMLSEGDVVTVGNIDLVVSGGTLVRRSETGATRTGGLEVRNVQYTVDNGKQLLRRHLADRAARNTDRGDRRFRRRQKHAGRLIAGYTTPSSGSVTFEGHDIHAEYASHAQPDRHGSAGRRRAPAADGQPGAGLRRRTAAAAGHQQSGPRQGRRAGARGTRPDQARRTRGSTSCPAASASAPRWRWSCSPGRRC